MSDQTKAIPMTPAEVIRRTLGEIAPFEMGTTERDQFVEDLLIAFEENDIDVTWKPAEKALD